MTPVAQIPAGEIVGTADQRVILYGVPWSHFEVIVALKGEAQVPRLTYLEGALELMRSSRTHEGMKKLLARMVELYAVRNGLRLSGYGSWLLKSAPDERAIEPDECYVLGDARLKETPDLAIEVVWTSGGLDKLEIYRKLGVREVWQWKSGALRVFELQDQRYVEIARSRLLPDLDPALLGRLAAYEDQHEALMEFQAALDAAG